MNKKLILLTAIMILVLISTTILAINIFTKKDASTITVVERNVTNKGVTITNLDKSKGGMSDDQIQNAQILLYKYIGTKSSYSATVRNGEYQKYKDGDYTNTTFLVDIPSAKRTYRITMTIAGPDDYRVVQVYCVKNSELKYENHSKCIDSNDG